MMSRIVEIIDSRLLLNGHKVFTSLEGMNPGGSIKDHMVKGELDLLFERGDLKAGDWISEVSSGSTALSLAYYCQMRSLCCHLFVPVDTNLQTLQLLKGRGAEIHLFARSEIYEAHAAFLQKYPSHFFNQLEDKKKSFYYQSLGLAFKKKCGRIDFVAGAVGTGHSLKGVSSAISGAQMISVEPEPSEPCNGVRNIETERYGSLDPCQPSEFQRRIIVRRSSFFSDHEIETDAGFIKINDSFKLVLGGILVLQREASYGSSSLNILALGSSNSL